MKVIESIIKAIVISILLVIGGTLWWNVFRVNVPSSSAYWEPSTATIDDPGAKLEATLREIKNRPTPVVTMNEFNSIATDMNYDQVVNLIGTKGKQVSFVEYQGYTQEIYSWENAPSIYAVVTVTFANGRVVAKSQVGL